MAEHKILVIGSGYMAEEYLKPLQTTNADVVVLGRDLKKARSLALKYGARGFGGGIAAINDLGESGFDFAIIASSIVSLKEAALACIDKGIQRILLEKPGALNLEELEEIRGRLKKNPKIRLGIAYNRRYYNAVQQLKNKIQEDGGALACFFDFTDREKDILGTNFEKEVLARWGFANASHVIDTAFYLTGKPVEIQCAQDGGWDCHPAGTAFTGFGRTAQCPFGYFATWAGGGRWNIEVSTKEGRYKLSPLEEIQFCKKNQFAWETLSLADEDDTKYKAGVYKMVKAVLADDFSKLPCIEEQIEFCRVIDRIFGY